MKSTANKILIAGVIGAAGVMAYLIGNAAKNFAYKITGYGTPGLNTTTWQLSLPIKVSYNNPTPVPINVDNLTTTILLFKGNAYEQVGSINQAVTIPPGSSTATIGVQIDLKKFITGNILATALNILQTRKVQLRTESRLQYGSIVVNTEPFEKVINV